MLHQQQHDAIQRVCTMGFDESVVFWFAGFRIEKSFASFMFGALLKLLVSAKSPSLQHEHQQRRCVAVSRKESFLGTPTRAKGSVHLSHT